MPEVEPMTINNIHRLQEIGQWNIGTLTKYPEDPRNLRLREFDFNYLSTKFAVVTGAGELYLFDVKTGEIINTFEVYDYIGFIQFFNLEEKLLIRINRVEDNLAIWDYENDSVEYMTVHGGYWFIDLSYDDQYAAFTVYEGVNDQMMVNIKTGEVYYSHFWRFNPVKPEYTQYEPEYTSPDILIYGYAESGEPQLIETFPWPDDIDCIYPYYWNYLPEGNGYYVQCRSYRNMEKGDRYFFVTDGSAEELECLNKRSEYGIFRIMEKGATGFRYEDDGWHFYDFIERTDVMTVLPPDLGEGYGFFSHDYQYYIRIDEVGIWYIFGVPVEPKD